MLISERITGLKSVLLAWSSYLPGLNNTNPNLPFSSEVVDFLSPPSSLARLIVTPWRAAPVGSNARPFRAPVEAVWQKALAAIPKVMAITAGRTQQRKCPRNRMIQTLVRLRAILADRPVLAGKTGSGGETVREYLVRTTKGVTLKGATLTDSQEGSHCQF